MKRFVISAGTILALLVTIILGVVLHMHLNASITIDRALLAKRERLIETADKIYSESPSSPCAFLANAVSNHRSSDAQATAPSDYATFKRKRIYLGFGLMMRGENYCFERLAAGPTAEVDCLNGENSEKAQMFCLFGVEPRLYDAVLTNSTPSKASASQ